MKTLTLVSTLTLVTLSAVTVLAQTPPASPPAAQPPAASTPPAAAPPAAAPAPAAPPAAAPPAAAAAPAAPLTGAAALGALAGNTLTGKIDGKDTFIFLANDGGMAYLEDSEQTQGAWELRGTNLCLLIKGEKDECYGLEVTAETAMLRENATTTYRLTIAKGNPKNLPPGKRP